MAAQGNSAISHTTRVIYICKHRAFSKHCGRSLVKTEKAALRIATVFFQTLQVPRSGPTVVWKVSPRFFLSNVVCYPIERGARSHNLFQKEYR